MRGVSPHPAAAARLAVHAASASWSQSPWADSRWWRLRSSYRGLRFLATQEQLHPQPTPEMTFVFMLVAVYPLAMSAFLLILLAEM